MSSDRISGSTPSVDGTGSNCMLRPCQMRFEPPKSRMGLSKLPPRSKMAKLGRLFLEARFHARICAITLKNPFATLLQSIAATFGHHPLEQLLHCPDLVDLYSELSEFSLRECYPSAGSWNSIAKTKEQLSNFVQGESAFPCALDDG